MTTPSPLSSAILGLLLPMLVADRRGMTHDSVWRFRSIRPKMEDYPVRLSRNCGDFLGLGVRHIENLEATRGDLDLVVMVVLVPCFQRYLRTRD